MAAARRGGWAWALALVASLHLLVTPGTWLVSDHAELIFMARRLLTRGTPTLGAPGEPLPGLAWVRVSSSEPTRSRLFPGTAVAVAPLLLLDRSLGWDEPRDQGRLVHLAGHVYLLGALALLGAALSAAGASAAAVAATIALTGTAWPIVQISRHGGAEPVVAFLLALFLWGVASRRFAARAAACVLLPWVHPTGCLLAPVLAAHRWLEGERRDAAVLGASALTSFLGVIVLWNGYYHGHWWGGGYAAQGASSGFYASRPAAVIAYYLEESLLLTPLVIALALIGALAAGRAGLRTLSLPLLLLALYLALFAAFSTPSGQEPARRLSVVWLAWGFALGLGWDRLRLSRLTALGLVALGAALGAYWFLLRESHYYPRPDGGYDPLVLWITLARSGRPAAVSLVPVIVLVSFALLAATRLWRLFAAAASERLPSTEA